MNKYIIFLSLVLPLQVFTINAFAEEGDVTGNVNRTITSMGCHLNDATCYINVNEAVGVEGECKGKSVRWKKDAVNGQEILSMFLAAKLSNLSVNLSIKNECFNGGGTYPTFNYMSINN